ncbi:zinc finger protein 425-like [Planococcus citri]|uniref:zinc finger protein 425-like n=1 Tax=Planococcus citri TaxID=170843 RepID=UPI0031F9156B
MSSLYYGDDETNSNHRHRHQPVNTSVVVSKSQDNTFPCPDCSSVFKHKSSLVTHLKAECGKRKLFTCNVCFKEFSYKSNLRSHMDDGDMITEYEEVEYIYGNPQPPNKKVSKSREKGIFPCPECGTIFQYKRSLWTHLKADCGKKKSFSCDVCGREFTYKQNLKTHMGIKHNILLKKNNMMIYGDPQARIADSVCQLQDVFSYSSWRDAFKSKPISTAYSKAKNEKKKLFTCDVCFREFCSILCGRDRQSHSQLIKTSGTSNWQQELFPCPNCRSVFKYKRNLSTHLKTDYVLHPDDDDETSYRQPHWVPNDDFETLPNVFPCPDCKSVFKHRRSLATHLKAICGKGRFYQCHKYTLQCDDPNYRQSNWPHEEDFETSPDVFPCPNCSSVFKHKASLSKHLKADCEIAIRGYKYDEMNFNLADPLLLSPSPSSSSSSLMRSTTNVSQDELSCHKCGNLFKYKHSLRNHMKTDCEIANCDWEYDEMNFNLSDPLSSPPSLSSSSSLMRNITSTNVSQGGLSCYKCGNSFKYKQNLVAHVKTDCAFQPCLENTISNIGASYEVEKKPFTIQRSQKGFKCPNCSNFVYIQSVIDPQDGQSTNVWVNTSTAELPGLLSCPHCGSVFKYKCNLTTHLKARCGQRKPFQCDVCFKSFGRKHTLRRHISCVHKIVPKK